MLFSDSNVKANSSDYILNTTTLPISPEFNQIEYNKLLSKFERLIAEKWCNTRRMIANRNEDSGLDLRYEFEKFAEKCRNNNEQGETEMKFYMEILNEVYDEQFIEFCATTLNIHKKQSFESSLSKLEYLANKGF